MPFSKTEATFGVNVTGESTGRLFAGTFKIKLSLSHRERLKVDQFRRELLGPNPEGQPIPEGLQQTSEVLAELRVRVLEGPSWWESSNFGVDMEDFKPIAELWNKTQKEVRAALGVLEEEGQKATEELKKDAAGNQDV